ncbi:hypothetical protein [Defluviimonas sp. SAOS-178_SWC]|uniref:hypothetical protein n=1 Tax=Defluviimonas sp. SAOS-178_SWC TaxID=3121287 RepID=UPI003221B3C4
MLAVTTTRSLLCAAVVVAATPALATCTIEGTGAKCLAVDPGEQTRAYAVGDAFPVYRSNMIIDVDRRGLPPVDGSWRYYEAGRDILRVDSRDFVELEVISGGRIP